MFYIRLMVYYYDCNNVFITRVKADECGANFTLFSAEAADCSSSSSLWTPRTIYAVHLCNYFFYCSILVLFMFLVQWLFKPKIHLRLKCNVLPHFVVQILFCKFKKKKKIKLKKEPEISWLPYYRFLATLFLCSYHLNAQPFLFANSRHDFEGSMWQTSGWAIQIQ